LNFQNQPISNQIANVKSKLVFQKIQFSKPKLLFPKFQIPELQIQFKPDFQFQWTTIRARNPNPKANFQSSDISCDLVLFSCDCFN